MSFKSSFNTENVTCLLSPSQESGPENVPLNDLGHDDCWDQEEEELDDKGRSKFTGHSHGSVFIEQLLRNHRLPPNTASSVSGLFQRHHVRTRQSLCVYVVFCL